MEKKKIIGIVMLGASIGVLFFLYKGYLQPRLEVDKEAKSKAVSSATPKITT